MLKDILKLYPTYDSVSGPYKDSGDRLYIVLNNFSLKKGTKGKLRTISYPKALMEIHLGVRLEDGLTVDHIDRDFNNNDLTNFRIVTAGKNASDDHIRVKVDPVKCPECGTEIIPTRAQRNSAKDRAGPFCSRVCSGKYGARVLYEGTRLERTEVIKTYYYLDKDCKSAILPE